MSPEEEYAERCRQVAPPSKLPDHVRAALMQATRHETVDGDGVIRFELLGRRYEYFHADSPTCQNLRGKRVLITFSYDFMEAIFVIGADKRFIETIPQKGTVQWFDAAALGREIRDQELQVAAARRELEKTHAVDIRRRAETGRRNLERLEIAARAHVVQTFPVERTEGRAILPAGDRCRESEADIITPAEDAEETAIVPVSRESGTPSRGAGSLVPRPDRPGARLPSPTISTGRGRADRHADGGPVERLVAADSAARRQVAGARREQLTTAARRQRALAALLG